MLMILEGLDFITTGAGGNGNAVDLSLDELDTADIVIVEVDTEVDGGNFTSADSVRILNIKFYYFRVRGSYLD